MQLKKTVFRYVLPAVAVVLVIVGQLAPVAAVRPQEGWYVRDTMTYTVDGKTREYFIIDNKMSSQPWYIQFYTGVKVLPDPVFMTPSWYETGLDVNWNCLGVASTWYRGYSDIDWCVDDDWLCLLDWNGLRFLGGYNSTSFSVFVFDKSKIPLLTYSVDADAYSITGVQDVLMGRAYNTEQSVQSPFGWVNESFDVYSGDTGTAVFRLGGLSQTDTSGSHMVFNPFFQGNNNMSPVNYYTVDGTSINDLCVVPFATGFKNTTGWQRGMMINLAISWAVPVDKCPAGTQVGDSWPKVRPIEVQMEDAYKAWMDSALQNTDYADSSNVGKDLKDYNDQLEASDNWGELATAGWAFIQPIFDSFDFVFVILGIAAVSFILLLLIKKGMG